MKIFIISWKGQHEKASKIAESISNVDKNVTIIFSDPDQNFTFNNSFNVIRRPNNLFWEDKFKSCLDSADDGGILIIHADCDCNDWSFLVKRCNDVINKHIDLGVWAPEIDGTFYNLCASEIFKIKNSKLVIAALTDGIVFYISPFIVNRMRQISYGNNKFGWGIDGLFCSASHINNKLVVIDTSINVLHNSKTTGYDKKLAYLGKSDFLKQFSTRELAEYKLLLSYVSYNTAKLLAGKNKFK
jgi:hypothetical protein